MNLWAKKNADSEYLLFNRTLKGKLNWRCAKKVSFTLISHEILNGFFYVMACLFLRIESFFLSTTTDWPTSESFMACRDWHWALHRWVFLCQSWHLRAGYRGVPALDSSREWWAYKRSMALNRVSEWHCYIKLKLVYWWLDDHLQYCISLIRC